MARRQFYQKEPVKLTTLYHCLCEEAILICTNYAQVATHTAIRPDPGSHVADSNDPVRKGYLARFADEEGIESGQASRQTFNL